MNIRIGSTRMALTLLAAFLLVVPAGSAAAQPQDFTPDTYTSVLTDFEITVSGPVFAITDASLDHYRTGDGEIVSIESDATIAEVSFFDDEDTPDDSLDAYLGNIEPAAQAFEVIDRSSNGNVYYAYAAFTYDDVDMLMYAQVTEDVIGTVDLFEMVITGEDLFVEELAAAQQEIEVDGIPFLADVDGAVLTGSASDNDAGDDIDNDSDLGGNPREDARIGDGQTTVSGRDSTPEVGTGDDDSTGILTDSSWQGPVFAHEFGWDPATWYIDPDMEGAIYTSEEELVDSITLSADGWVTTPYAYLAVIDDQAHSPADYLGYWSSDDYVLGVLVGGDEGEYEILSSRSRPNGVGVVIHYTVNGNDYVRVNQMTELEDGTLFMSQIDTSIDDIAEVFDVAMTDLTLDGESLPQILTSRQVERAVGE